MSVSIDAVSERQFCSVNAKALGADPVGTAPMYDEFVMFEFDLPWARNVMESSGFPAGIAAVVAGAKEQGRRAHLQCFAPDGRYSRSGMRRVMYFCRSTHATAAEARRLHAHVESPAEYAAVEYVVPVADAEALIRFLLLDVGDRIQFESFRVERDGMRDLFVCTHGARDACCGKYGAALQMELDALAGATMARRERAEATKTSESAKSSESLGAGHAIDANGTRGETRVWRVSHLGGHRFAPTLLELPAARYWGALESPVLQQLVDGPAHLELLRPYYRGWSATHSPEEQVAEAEAWRRIGPAWLTYDKTIRTVARQEDGAEIEITARSPMPTQVLIDWTDPHSGKQGRIDVSVDVGHVLSLHESCGAEEVQSKQYVVARYDEMSEARVG